LDPSLQPCFRVADNVDCSLLPGEPVGGFRPVAADADGRLETNKVIAAQQWNGPSPLIVVVADDLRVPGCDSVFGFAQPAAGVAVASTFHLRGTDDVGLSERLGKVIAHEWMHLRGRPHCAEVGCLMHPVTTVEELDARPDALCPRCRRRRSWKGAAVAAALIVVLFATIDFTVDALQTKSRPFHWRRQGKAAELLYRGEKVLWFPEAESATSPSQNPAETARVVASRLNSMFVKIDPPVLSVTTAAGVVRVVTADSPLFTVTPSMTGNADVVPFAVSWAAGVQLLLEGKGRQGESCPMCHIARRQQVRESMTRPPRFWR